MESTRHFSLVEESEETEKQEEYKGKDFPVNGIGPESDQAEEAQKAETSKLGIQPSGELPGGRSAFIRNNTLYQ